MKTGILFFLVIFLFSSYLLQAQTQDTSLVNIETVDGNTFLGKVISEDSITVILQTDNLGKITIQKRDIKLREIVEVEQIKEGEVWFANPQSTRYFWAPNGYGLKKGEGYYQNIYVLWNQFSVGVTNYFSVGGGLIPLFLFGGSTPVFIVPKFSIPIDPNKLNLGVGALLGAVLGETDASFGLLYGLSTFGSPDNNLSIGLGYGFSSGEWADSPVINVSGMFRTGKRGYFITENYFIDGFALISLGGRWIIKKASLDFMFGIPMGEDVGIVAIPAIGFTIPF